MKAKEAPEKLYITYKGYGVFDEDSTVERTKDSQTEYTCTDTFIDKAEEFIYAALNDGIIGTVNIEDFMRLFKNYMKGE